MSFYKEIEQFSEYIKSIRKLKDYLSFDLYFPSKWGLPKDGTQIIPFESDVANHKGLSFVTEMKDKEVTNTITKILKVIKINKERELKEMLFKQTVEQLKKTFENNDLDKLQNLYFDFENHELDEPEIGEESDSIELAE
jgi:hypothetical protein